ncbi:MAG: hypothetical protein IJS02_03635 [Bacteroidales bacterium]|nr:hypothetical protein [Bacteroidales bacterium]
MESCEAILHKVFLYVSLLKFIALLSLYAACDVTGQMRTFLERLAFPWLSYNDYSLTAPKKTVLRIG